MEFINQNILLISIVVVSGLGLIWPMLTRTAANQVGAAAATQLINREAAIVIDVRNPDEFAAGHLPDALNIPLDKLAERVGEIEKYKEKPVILCCAAGMRSGKGCAELAKLGFSRVHSLAEGVDGWVGAGYPIKKGGNK